MEKRVKKELLFVFFFIMIFVVISGVNALQCYETSSYNENQYYKTKACTSSCGTPNDEPKTCAECYSLISDEGMDIIKMECYEKKGASKNFWNAELPGCGWFGYRDVMCWKVLAKKDNFAKVTEPLILNKGTNKDCNYKCNSNTRCVGIDIFPPYGGLPQTGPLGRFIMKDNQGQFYTFNGDCETIMKKPSSYEMMTYCYCLGCRDNYADCNNNLNDGCEAHLKSDENNCGACGIKCAPNQQCSSGHCGGVAIYDNCGWDHNFPWMNPITGEECPNSVEVGGKGGCVRDTDGNGKYDQVCCVDQYTAERIELNANDFSVIQGTGGWYFGQCSKY